MRVLAIGLLGIVLVHGTAFAQTPQEQEKILAMFSQSVANYTELNQCTDPAPPIFTLPVATVFRQIIARAVGTTEPHEFPALLARALPALPPALEYRLVGDDLVLRDVRDDVMVAVLRDAVGAIATRR